MTRIIRTVLVTLALGAAGCEPKAAPECISVPAETPCKGDRTSDFYCDACGQNWYCASLRGWQPSDWPCECNLPGGNRDTADTACRDPDYADWPG
jgi:hypothetical protein